VDADPNRLRLPVAEGMLTIVQGIGVFQHAYAPGRSTARRRGRRRRHCALLAALSTALFACALGPNYERPETEIPAEFRAALDAPEAASLADLPWWEIFDDPALVTLVSIALEENLDLAQATARVEQSRAQLGVARSGFYPQVGYSAEAGRTRLPRASKPGEDHTTFNSFSGALSLAWEIDLWGRVRRSSEAAQAQVFGARAARRGLMLTLVSEVASAYFQLIELDRELEIAEQSKASFQATLDLFEARSTAGIGSRLQTTRARAALANAAAAIPRIHREITKTENRLSLLLGNPPGGVLRGKPLVEQEIASRTPAGLPAQLLERRPDIVEAEEELVAANAMVGVALANFLPRIGLTSAFGGTSTELSDLVTGSASLWNLLGEVTGPLFSGGLRLAQYRGQQSVWEEARARYEQTVLTALVEVSDALAARETLANERANREEEVANLKDSVELARERYTQGLASYFEIIDAQQELLPAELELARVQRAQLDAFVQLYRALGGGWNLEETWQPSPELETE
jgi:multidrug efflux system outer membrane protein